MTAPTPPENLLRCIHMFQALEVLPLPWKEGVQPLRDGWDTLPPPCTEDDEPALVIDAIRWVLQEWSGAIH